MKSHIRISNNGKVFSLDYNSFTKEEINKMEAFLAETDVDNVRDDIDHILEYGYKPISKYTKEEIIDEYTDRMVEMIYEELVYLLKEAKDSRYNTTYLVGHFIIMVTPTVACTAFDILAAEKLVEELRGV